MNFNLYMPVKVVSGDGCVEKNAAELKKLGRRCLIVTGKSSAVKSGALRDAVKALTLGEIEYEVFDEIGQNPLISVCCKAGAAARAFKADFIMGIGGGSPLDAAKAAAVYATNEGLAPAGIYGAHENRALPLCFIGTTAGTGSEVTPIAVLTVDGQNIKKSVNFEECYAKIVFADPKYTFSCDYDVTVSTALDALCHAVEGYYSPKGGDIAREFALTAVNYIWNDILNLHERPGTLPDNEARERLYYGSLWAGLALNLSLTAFPHAAGYVLTTDYGVPHGKACAVFMPSFLKHNAPADTRLTKRLFDAVGCGIDDFCAVVTSLANVKHIDFTMEQCALYAKQLEGRFNLINSIKPSTVSDMQAVYEELFCNI